MDTDEMIALCKEHTMYTWTKGEAVNPLPIERAEGIYMYTPEGERVIDFNSQLMCVNIGHGHPKVQAAMKAQIDQLTYVYPGTATAVRARLGKCTGRSLICMLVFVTVGSRAHVWQFGSCRTPEIYCT